MRWLPATSVAVTVNVLVPTVLVSMSSPSSTVPTQPSSSEPPASTQVYDAATSWCCPNVAPSAGVTVAASGSVLSRRTGWIRLALRLPLASSARISTYDVPSAVTATSGPVAPTRRTQAPTLPSGPWTRCS